MLMLPLLPELGDSPYWVYPHEKFLESRRKKMAESENYLRKTVDQMINFLKNNFRRNVNAPGWIS